MNTTMPASLKPFYKAELQAYHNFIANGSLHAAWTSLERAHVIGQKYPVANSYVHWKMLLFGFKIKSWKEVFGQIPRLLVGGVKSFVGAIPAGNTGGANIPPLQSLPIPEDIQRIFKKAGVKFD